MPRILVVDDDPDVLTVLCRLAEVGGHTTVPALGANMALATPGPFDALLTDVNMPGTDGFELAARLALPTVFVSALPPGEIPAGAVFLPKPLTSAGVAAAIAAVIGAAQ